MSKQKISIVILSVLLLALCCFTAMPSMVSGEIDSEIYHNALSASTTVVSHATEEKLRFPMTGTEEDYDYDSKSVSLEDGESVSYEISLAKEGQYILMLDTYSPEEVNLLPVYFSLAVNGETEHNKINLSKYLVNIGNDFVSEKTQALDLFVYTSQWETCAFTTDGILGQAVTLSLPKGESSITLTKSSGEMVLGDIYLKEISTLPTYQEYSQEYANIPKGSTAYYWEAENISFKNQSTINPMNSSDIQVTPYAMDYKYLNVLDGDSFHEHNQSIGYVIEVAEAGMYPLGFHYRSGTKTNSTSYGNLLVNGTIPFAEFENYAFPYSKNFTTVLTPEMVYLEAGENVIEIQISQALFSQVYEQLVGIYDEISAVSIEMRMLTGNKVDNNRSWVVSDYFPELKGNLQDWSLQLEESKAYLENLNGGFVTEETMYLNLAIEQIDTILEDFNQLPNRMNLLSTGNDSVSARVSFVMSSLQNSPLFLDACYLAQSIEEIPNANYGSVAKFQNSLQKLGNSFLSEETEEEEVIEVWVRRARQNVEAMQALVDSEFTAQTGIKVSLNVLMDQSKLTLANAAGTTPDVVLGADSWYISDIGQRGALEDLKDYPGAKELVSQVTPGALLQMYVDDSLYGIPESQEFYFTIYRKDILEDLGLEVPNTWEDVQKMLPILQRYGMNFYAPISQEGAMKAYPATAPIFFQHGVDIFSSDGLSTDIVSDKGLEAFELMTDLVVINGMTLQVASFYDSFRNGNIPIGVTKFSEYIRLYHAAPEILGNWGIALSPGVMHEDGSIDRTVTGDSAAVMMFKDSDQKDASWEFIQWWLSADTQISYLTNLQNTFGAEYVYIPANINALDYLPFPKEDIEVFKEQISYVREVPRIPGGYVAEREISDAFSKVVNEGRDIRGTLNEKKTIIDRELRRKLEEFGYLSNGEVVVPYEVETIESIERWLYDERE
ncbi:MAG: extracellular solute-binding protein [Eubacteriales bacterium]